MLSKSYGSLLRVMVQPSTPDTQDPWQLKNVLNQATNKVYQMDSNKTIWLKLIESPRTNKQI